jgi:hypothetical protein
VPITGAKVRSGGPARDVPRWEEGELVSYSCVKHPMAVAEYVCGQCGHEFCPECVVFPYGVDKPPVCITCALQMAGVAKRATGRPKLSRRAVRKRLKEHAKARSASAPVAPEVAEEQPEPDDDRWMHGFGDPDDFPGGWKQQY